MTDRDSGISPLLGSETLLSRNDFYGNGSGRFFSFSSPLAASRVPSSPTSPAPRSSSCPAFYGTPRPLRKPLIRSTRVHPGTLNRGGPIVFRGETRRPAMRALSSALEYALSRRLSPLAYICTARLVDSRGPGLHPARLSTRASRRRESYGLPTGALRESCVYVCEPTRAHLHP